MFEPAEAVEAQMPAHIDRAGLLCDVARGLAMRQKELDPKYFQVSVELGRAYLQLHRCSEALDALESGAEYMAGIFRGSLGYAYSLCGRSAQALAELARLRDQASAGLYVSHIALAVIRAGLGDRDRAFAELDSAYTERAWAMFTLNVEPAFDDLRSDPRFTALLSRVGLNQTVTAEPRRPE